MKRRHPNAALRWWAVRNRLKVITSHLRFPIEWALGRLS
jgi:hypothetical protein